MTALAMAHPSDALTADDDAGSATALTENEVLGRVQAELDTQSFRHVTKVLQPTWVRTGAFVLPGALGGLALYSSKNPGLAILTAVVALALLQVVRYILIEHEVRAFREGRAGEVERYTLSGRGFKTAERLIPWTEVRVAAEINNPKAGFSLLAVRAGGRWNIWPSHGFLTGNFRDARELLVKATGGPLRTVRL